MMDLQEQRANEGDVESLVSLVLVHLGDGMKCMNNWWTPNLGKQEEKHKEAKDLLNS